MDELHPLSNERILMQWEKGLLIKATPLRPTKIVMDAHKLIDLLINRDDWLNDEDRIMSFIQNMPIDDAYKENLFLKLIGQI